MCNAGALFAQYSRKPRAGLIGLSAGVMLVLASAALLTQIAWDSSTTSGATLACTCIGGTGIWLFWRQQVKLLPCCAVLYRVAWLLNCSASWGMVLSGAMMHDFLVCDSESGVALRGAAVSVRDVKGLFVTYVVWFRTNCSFLGVLLPLVC